MRLTWPDFRIRVVVFKYSMLVRRREDLIFQLSKSSVLNLRVEVFKNSSLDYHFLVNKRLTSSSCGPF